MPLSHFTYMALSPSSSYRLLAVPPAGLPVGRAIWIRAVLAHSAWRLDTAERKQSWISKIIVNQTLESSKTVIIKEGGLKNCFLCPKHIVFQVSRQLPVQPSLSVTFSRSPRQLLPSICLYFEKSNNKTIYIFALCHTFCYSSTTVVLILKWDLKELVNVTASCNRQNIYFLVMYGVFASCFTYVVWKPLKCVNPWNSKMSSFASTCREES